MMDKGGPKANYEVLSLLEVLNSLQAFTIITHVSSVLRSLFECRYINRRLVELDVPLVYRCPYP